jgi:hypothetical protein
MTILCHSLSALCVQQMMDVIIPLTFERSKQQQQQQQQWQQQAQAAASTSSSKQQQAAAGSSSQAARIAHRGHTTREVAQMAVAV